MIVWACVLATAEADSLKALKEPFEGANFKAEVVFEDAKR